LKLLGPLDPSVVEKNVECKMLYALEAILIFANYEIKRCG
jgi:hypothetical protein